MSKSKWNNCKDRLYTEQEKSNKTWIYSAKSCKGVYICSKYADIGIRIRLEYTSGKKKAGTNPHKLIYPQSGYLGILPPDESGIELLGKAFRHQFRKSPFEQEIHKYYLSRVDLCTNIHCDNKNAFRELVGKCHPDQPYRSYEDGWPP